MSWAKSIILVFMLFAVFIGVLVTICIRQDISLVSANYYADELVYQHQIDRLNNTAGLVDKPIVKFAGLNVEVRYPDLPRVTKAELKLFRPSDLRYDKSFTFTHSMDTVQRFHIGQMPSGMYKARLLWMMDGKEYFSETMINL